MIAVEMNSTYLGVSTLQLMENAGKSVADAVKDQFPSSSTVDVLCGLSGNGGDGFVAARHLAIEGYNVTVYIVGEARNIKHSNSFENYQALKEMKSSVKIVEIKDSSFIPEFNSDVIIDGLIGTSMKGSLQPPFLQIVKKANKSKAFKISIDVPTGMVVDTGEIHGECIQSELTLTFHKPKLGYKTSPKELGKLHVVSIGIPFEAEQFTGPGNVYIAHPLRKPEAHKGMYGRLLVVGGSETYSGAPSLTAMAAYSTGIDLVYVAAPETAATAIAGFSPSLITTRLEGNHLSLEHIDIIKPLMKRVDAVAIGPGLGLHPDTVKAISKLIKQAGETRLPLVVDADGLKAYAEKKTNLKTPTVFTPHSREFEMLTGIIPKGNYLEKGDVVCRSAKALKSIILLKGAVDIISDGERTRFNWTGNPGMTVGGTGDVLTGITAGYLALGVPPMEAASAAAFINGYAGDEVYKEKGYHILPEDLIGKIPGVVERSVKGKLRRA
jgi:NAD(P)H-hydrate epimerase